MRRKIGLNSGKHADLGMSETMRNRHAKRRSDGSEIEDTRNKWQRIFDEKYGDVGRYSLGLERWRTVGGLA